jgi:hypothetical protein
VIVEPKDGGQWFDNKALYLMLQELKGDMQTMSLELKQTREIVAKYNGLRERIEDCSDEIEAMKNKAVGQSSVGNAVRAWGGWIFGLVSLGIAFYKLGG